MSLPLQTVKPDDWLTVNRNFNKIKTSLLGDGASPTFAGMTLTGLTDNSLIYPVSGLLTSLGAATNGQIPIGSTGVAPVLATITGSTPVKVTNAAGSIILDINLNSINDTHIDWGLGASQVNAADVPIALGVGSPTVDQIQEYFDNTGSSGYFTGGVLSDGGSGTLDVSAGEGFIRTTDADNAPLVSFKFSGVTGLAIADNTTQYVFVNDSGTINLSTDEFIEAADNIMLGVVTDEGGVISHAFNLGVRLEESIGQMGRYIRHVDDIVRNKRKGGLIFGQSSDANRDVTITEGQLEWGRTSYPISAFDTSGADTFDTYSAGGQEATGVSAWPNEQYDNAGTLTTMINNRWAVLWWYIEPDGHIVMLYGRDQYVTEGQAEEEEQPSSSIPNRLSSASVIASKFIFQKSSNIATKIETAFGTPFSGSGVTAHNNLSILAWTSASHTGTVSTLAGFDGAGAAAEYTESNYLLVDGTRALTGAWSMGSQILTNVNIDTGDINVAVTNTEWDAAYTHSQLTSGNPHVVTPTELSLVIGTNVLAEQTIGIADNNLMEVDDADAADNDYAKFTTAGLEGRSFAEVKSDLTLNLVENTAHSTDAHTMTIDGRDVSTDGSNLDDALGSWTSMTFDAGDFTGNGSMTWTVEEADVVVNKYKVTGKTVVHSFEIKTSAVAGTLNTTLFIDLADVGNVTQNHQYTFIYNQDTWVQGACVVEGSSSKIAFYPDFTYGGGNWLNRPFTYIRGTVIYEID